MTSDSPPGAAWTAWSEPERILALQLYLILGPAGRTHGEVVALSEELNRLALHPEAGTRSNFRNPSGVAMKLANFAALDPNHVGKGLSRCSAGDRDTWAKYATDVDLLHAAAERIRSSAEAQRAWGADAARQRSTEDRTAVRSSTSTAARREALVGQFGAWLEQQNHVAEKRRYEVGGSSLQVDLYDITSSTTWTVLGVVSRSAIRSAIGELLDLHRFDTNGRVGVVLPWTPADDLRSLLASVGAAVAIPIDRDRFVIS